MTSFVAILAVICLSIGIVVWSSNPYRFSNQLFTFGALIMSSWLLIVSRIVSSEIPPDPNINLTVWYKANAAVVAFWPWTIWLIKESLGNQKSHKQKVLKNSVPWLLFCVSAALLSYTETFAYRMPDGSYQRGRPYMAYALLYFSANMWLIVQIYRQLREATGIRRVETQFLALNLGWGALLGVGFVALGNLLHIIVLKHLGLFFFVGCYVIAAWGITFHRVFDARQVFFSLGQRVGLVLTLSSCIFLGWYWLAPITSPGPALLTSIAISSAAAFWLDRKSRQWLDLGGEKKLGELRSSVIQLARTELRPEELIERFEALLREHSQTSFATLLFDRDKVFASQNSSLAKDRAGYPTLREIGWATPESLQRRRANPGITDLRDLLLEQSLGLLVTVPAGSPAPTLVVALGMKKNQWPYTYPEVQRIQNIAELMDNILTRSRLAAQAANQARIQHLAMMSRGLAHDLKNLITPVSSFLISTDEHFPAGSAEAEVHADARRSMRVMTDYVREALFFSERLAPKLEPFEFQGMFDTVRGLTLTRATRRGVQVSLVAKYRERMIADAVLIQRLVTNLVNNAIDASATGTTVEVIVEGSNPGWVRLRVSDEGCGIAPEHRDKIFEPYFTTKEFGEEVRGFGLGLTVCQKIVDVHGGRISVESELGRGTIFTVEIPNQSLSPSSIPQSLRLEMKPIS